MHRRFATTEAAGVLQFVNCRQLHGRGRQPHLVQVAGGGVEAVVARVQLGGEEHVAPGH